MLTTFSKPRHTETRLFAPATARFICYVVSAVVVILDLCLTVKFNLQNEMVLLHSGNQIDFGIRMGYYWFNLLITSSITVNKLEILKRGVLEKRMNRNFKRHTKRLANAYVYELIAVKPSGTHALSVQKKFLQKFVSHDNNLMTIAYSGVLAGHNNLKITILIASASYNQIRQLYIRQLSENWCQNEQKYYTDFKIAVPNGYDGALEPSTL
ncbi:hypothetical protein GQX74_004211 [Glossina fuscipes]|nr:hypothetical protein GQX74_004211 [Glossina fuscipes]